MICNAEILDEAIEQAMEELRPLGIVRIRYSFGEDWGGDPAVFFRVVITDELARGLEDPLFRLPSIDARLIPLAADGCMAHLRDLFLDWPPDYRIYRNYRSVSEQAARSGDLEWE